MSTDTGSTGSPTAPPSAPAASGAGLNPVGVFMAVAFSAAILWIVVPMLLRSGELGVIVHGLAFLLTGGLVVGGILYSSTLSE